MPTLSSVEEETHEATWELLVRVMTEGERHQLNSNILTPYHTQLLALINQQIKSVFDELEDEAEAFERTSKERDGLTHFAVPLSTIQKIRSRYE